MNDLTVTIEADIHPALAAIDNCQRLADSTRRQYHNALVGYLGTGAELKDAAALAAYARTLPASSRAFLKAAVRLVTAGLANGLKGQATPDNVNGVQAALYRLEALQGAIETHAQRGRKLHTWLTAAEVERLLATCDTSTLLGRRDRVLLGLLAGAGLRRAEAAALRFTDVALLPVKGRMRTVLQVRGKGDKLRAVPISDALANGLDDWAAEAGAGRVLRSVDQGGRLAASMSQAAIFDVVRARGALIGKPDLAPHDLRRTFAQLGYEAGVPLVQISRLLGHSSVTTTQRYLNLDLDLKMTASDFVPF